ncbi:MAG: hypothetical protein PHI13_02335 [Methylococcales bacterium]|nr:hypothetical protein [Methylococcales bacterium]
MPPAQGIFHGNFRDKGVSRMQEQVYALKVVAPVRTASPIL